MSAKRLLVAILSVVTMLGASALAQDERNEIGGLIGRTFISDQGIKGVTFFDPIIHSGKGLTFEGEYARRFIVTPIWSVSGEALIAYDHKIKLNAGQFGNSVVPLNYKSLFITPAARVNLFPTTAVSPWASLGAGFGHFSEDDTLLYGGGANPGKSTTGAVIEAGFGLDVKVAPRVYIRGEVRDFWSGEPDFPLAPTGKTRQHNFFVGGGAFWRF